jgi:Mg2+-importing ATPase
VFGPLSSIFDLLTFGVLLWIMHADQALFHTGWFIESVLSAGLVVFAIRTRIPFIKSHPSWTMLLVTLVVGVIALLLPYSPLANLLGLKPLSLPILGMIAGIVILYFISAEFLKRWFFQRFFA